MLFVTESGMRVSHGSSPRMPPPACAPIPSARSRKQRASRDARARVLDVAHEFRSRDRVGGDLGGAGNKPNAERSTNTDHVEGVCEHGTSASAASGVTLLDPNRQDDGRRLAARDAPRHRDRAGCPIEQPRAVDRERIDGHAPASERQASRHPARNNRRPGCNRSPPPRRSAPPLTRSRTPV